MRVVMLSWEYPPMRVGGIAAALEGLAPALARTGIEVHVVTAGSAGGAVDEEQAPNLFIHRVDVEENASDFVHWVHLLNGQMERRADALISGWRSESARKQKPVVLHVHDWLGLFAGRALKYRYKIPLLSTIHATEFGRNNGIHTEIQRYINQCEWDLQWESWRVIVCSGFMKGEVGFALRTPPDKIDIIYNGVPSEMFEFPFEDNERTAFRARFALPNEKIVFFIGRMVREKGAQILIESLPRLRYQYHDAKLVIAGGGQREHLEQLARHLGVAPFVYFTGRVSDHDRDRLYKIADVAVYPSLYEPFGIVALEAMAARVPVVVSDAGGLPEVVQHDVTGTVTFSGSPDSLAWGIARVLKNPELAQQMAGMAYQRVHNVFNWDRLAKQTAEVYNRVWSEYQNSDFARQATLTATIAVPKKARATKTVRVSPGD
ncbi:MAG: glycosyltransferase family 4 protein [Cytophagales bacterium]|nr:glycosyltransferase family 4 protein [Armatimonadota bacterium]